MPTAYRPRRQATYELLRPIVLCGQPIPDRARETGVPERIPRRRVSRSDTLGLRSLFEGLTDPELGRRRLPTEIRRAIVALAAEYPPSGLREIAASCAERFDRPVSHPTLKQELAGEPLPPRRRGALRAATSSRFGRAAPRGRDVVPGRMERQGDRRPSGHRAIAGLGSPPALGGLRSRRG